MQMKCVYVWSGQRIEIYQFFARTQMEFCALGGVGCPVLVHKKLIYFTPSANCSQTVGFSCGSHMFTSLKMQWRGSLVSKSLISTVKLLSHIDATTSCDLVTEAEHVKLLRLHPKEVVASKLLSSVHISTVFTNLESILSLTFMQSGLLISSFINN